MGGASALDQLLQAQRTRSRGPVFSERGSIYFLMALAAIVSSLYILAIHHYLTIFAYVIEHRGIAFLIPSLPFAVVAAFARFNGRATAAVISAAIVAATLALVIALSEGRGIAVLYALLSGDFQNAFWQYPPVLINMIFAYGIDLLVWYALIKLGDTWRPLTG